MRLPQPASVSREPGCPERHIRGRPCAPLADYAVVYFATHGLVVGDVKGLAEPSLALSIPKQPLEFDDGLLTASEVAQLKCRLGGPVRLQYHRR